MSMAIDVRIFLFLSKKIIYMATVYKIIFMSFYGVFFIHSRETNKIK